MITDKLFTGIFCYYSSLAVLSLQHLDTFEVNWNKHTVFALQLNNILIWTLGLGLGWGWYVACKVGRFPCWTFFYFLDDSIFCPYNVFYLTALRRWHFRVGTILCYSEQWIWRANRGGTASRWKEPTCHQWQCHYFYSSCSQSPLEFSGKVTLFSLDCILYYKINSFFHGMIKLIVLSDTSTKFSFLEGISATYSEGLDWYVQWAWTSGFVIILSTFGSWNQCCSLFSVIVSGFNTCSFMVVLSICSTTGWCLFFPICNKLALPMLERHTTEFCLHLQIMFPLLLDP